MKMLGSEDIADGRPGKSAAYTNFRALAAVFAADFAKAGTIPKCLTDWNYTDVKTIFLMDGAPVVLRKPGDRAASFGFAGCTGCAIVDRITGAVRCTHVSPISWLPAPAEHEYAVYFAKDPGLCPSARAEVRTYGDSESQIWQVCLDADGRLRFTDAFGMWHGLGEKQCAHPYCDNEASAARCASCGIAYCTPYHRTHHWDHCSLPHARSCGAGWET